MPNHLTEAQRDDILTECRIEGDSRYTLRTSAQAFLKGAEFALNISRRAKADATTSAASEVGLTDEQIELFAARLVREEGLRWAGFREDADGKFTIPVVSKSVCNLVRAALAARPVAQPDAGAWEAKILGEWTRTQYPDDMKAKGYEVRSALAASAQATQAVEPVADIDAIIRDVGELEYTSPDDLPDVLMAKPDELRLIIERHLSRNTKMVAPC